jgi:hypothetical protein
MLNGMAMSAVLGNDLQSGIPLAREFELFAPSPKLAHAINAASAI